MARFVQPFHIYPLLNIRSEAALRQSPSAGAVWETFVFTQLRHRERRGLKVFNPFKELPALT